MTEPAIHLKELRVDLDEAEFDLTVPHHHCVAVIGDEKSGVDFLCECLLGLRRPARGEARIEGDNLCEMDKWEALARRRQVGYLPAGDGLMQNLTLRANIALPLRFGSDFNEREINSRVGIILASLRIVDQADWRPAAVSEEVRRRAGIARALAFDPTILLLEQPFDGITQRASAELLEIVRGGEHEEGSRRTVLVTGQHLPDLLKPRIETIFRVSSGGIEAEVKA